MTPRSAVAALVAGGAFVTGSLTTAGPPVAPAPSTSPSSTASASAAPAVESEIPEDFPIAEGIGAPEDIWATELARDDDTAQAWYAVPCTGPDERVTFPADERRTAARLVWIEGDFWGKSRQVLVYEDFAAAKRAFAGLEKRLTTCAETDETPPGAQPTTWEVESYSGNEDTPAWITAMGSASGDGSHAFFTDITATQVGRSVIVSRTGRNEQQRKPWQRLEDSHEVVLRAAWCLWMQGPCGSGPRVTRSPRPPVALPRTSRAGRLPASGSRCPRPMRTPGATCWSSTTRRLLPPHSTSCDRRRWPGGPGLRRLVGRRGRRGGHQPHRGRAQHRR